MGICLNYSCRLMAVVNVGKCCSGSNSSIIWDVSLLQAVTVAVINGLQSLPFINTEKKHQESVLLSVM